MEPEMLNSKKGRLMGPVQKLSPQTTSADRDVEKRDVMHLLMESRIVLNFLATVSQY